MLAGAHKSLLTIVVLAVCLPAIPAWALELWVGTARESITPPEPVALEGQRHTRIAREVESPVTANALALESRAGDSSLDQAIVVSCDLVCIAPGLQQMVRDQLAAQLPGFDPRKFLLTATHTHTAPVTLHNPYVIPAEGVMQPDAYVAWLVPRLAGAAKASWENRQRSGVSWGLGHASVAHNRRAVYANGTATMYGATNTPEFRGLEGYEDHGVDVLFFWTPGQRLTALAVNVACPAQEVEGRSAINADYWHEVRTRVQQRFQSELPLLGWIGASGDQSPHLLYYQRAEERMRTLRGIAPLEEIARRLDRAVEEAHEGAAKDIRFDVPLKHVVKELQLVRRVVTESEYAAAKAYCDNVAGKERQGQPVDPGEHVQAKWYEDTLHRYAIQKDQPTYAVELHVIRLGDIAICTNPFELFTDYGIQIKARSKAIQTFVVQLASDTGIYLATDKALRGGGYGAEIYSNIVSPEGGQQLVDQTVETINSLWD
jgi:hypothetical protein